VSKGEKGRGVLERLARERRLEGIYRKRRAAKGEKESDRDKQTQNCLFTLSMPKTEEMLGMEGS
jgi:hypothetical protein